MKSSKYQEKSQKQLQIQYRKKTGACFMLSQLQRKEVIEANIS